jgi:threonine/homoserine/homoserine lactone efflux protein
METAFAFVKGVIIGLITALPSGPVGFICLRRIFTQGRTIGFISGVGTSFGDAFYAFIAALGLASLAQTIPHGELWIKVIGGVFLLIFGVKIMLSKPIEFGNGDASVKNITSAFSSAFMLTLANPTIIFSYAALFAGMGLLGASDNYGFAGALAGGIFLGAVSSWFLVSRLEQTFRSRLTPTGMKWIDISIGCIVLGFGVISLLSSASLF